MTLLRPFFSFYGAKWRAAPTYPAAEHDLVIEPFAGSAGYSTRLAIRRVLLVEKDPAIAAIWRYLIRVSPDEVLQLPNIAPDQTIDDVHACEEARLLIGFWLSRGTEYPRRTPSAWMRQYALGTEMPTGDRSLQNRRSSFWGPEARQRIASQVGAIREWRVIEGSYEDAPDVEATWFIDPPYEGEAGRAYRQKKLCRPALADWCCSRRGLVIVCEGPEATWLPFQPHGEFQGNKGRYRSRVSHECVYVQRTVAPVQLDLLRGVA